MMKYWCPAAALVLILFGGVRLADARTDSGVGTENAVSRKRPNILFIIADDQSPFSLSAYGNRISRTPNLDDLARSGMRIDGAYHMGGFMGAVCTTSRHMIMSGRTLWHIPRAVTRQAVLESQKNPDQALPRNVDNPNVPKYLEQNTLAAVFNRAGYDTMRTCKKGNSYPAANKQFKTVRDASKRGPTAEDGSAWHADQVLEYLKKRQQSETDQPFLICFGFSHPHDPRWASEELLGHYGAVNKLPQPSKPNPAAPPLPVNYLPEHPFHHGHPGLRDEVAVQGVLTHRDEATIRNEKGREYACIENIDRQVGRVLSKLDEMGELENTYVIYTSDHGIAIGRHGLMGKQNLYEHTWRVPFLVMGPGIKAGSSAQGNIYLLDVLATLCDLAGIDPPETNEGVSAKPVLMGKKGTVREVLYGCYCGGTKPGMRSIRQGDWKLIRYETLNGTVKQTQLFNLKENPNELLKQHRDDRLVEQIGNLPSANQRNLADDPRYSSKRKELEELLLAEMKRLDDPYRFDEGYVNPKPAPRRKIRGGKKLKSSPGKN